MRPDYESRAPPTPKAPPAVRSERADWSRMLGQCFNESTVHFQDERGAAPARRERTMSGARHRQKGDRCERELVERHQALGIHAERYPLSGASRFRGSGHDLDIYALGRDAAPLIAESQARKSGNGFKQLETWLGDFDL